MFAKPIDSSAPIHELLQKRWSGRAYDSVRDVSDEILQSVMEAGRWAPSCFNEQPWRFVFCRKSSNPNAWQKAFDCLWPLNQGWCQAAPVLVITCAKTQFTHNGEPNSWAIYDAGAAALSISLQTAALGLMAHQMAGFDPQKARDSFAIPDLFVPVAMMAIGYQLPAEAVPEALCEKEMAPRQRNPLSQHFFAGAWDKAL